MLVFTGTKLQKKLLGYLFAHLDESYYLRELSGLINEDPGNMSRELSRLTREGLLKSVCRGRQKYYSLNREYALFNEIKSIIAKTSGVEGSLKELVERYKGISLFIGLMV